jgi:hypothetical protein
MENIGVAGKEYRRRGAAEWQIAVFSEHFYCKQTISTVNKETTE